MTLLTAEGIETEHNCRSNRCIESKHLQCGRYCLLCGEKCACSCHQGQPKREKPWGCSFPKCTNKHLANGYCNGHYTQIRKGRPLVPLKRQRTKKL